MREIEIKATVGDKQALIDVMNRAGVQLSEPIKQHDVVYGRPGAGDNEPGSIWLRIRTENDNRTIFTFKQQHSGGLDSIEHETEVNDADAMTAIIRSLGFELYSDLTKTRQKARYNGIEICLDQVENLGVYIEAEQLAYDDADGSVVIEQLWKVLDSFGVDRANEVFDGYDVLMNQKLVKTSTAKE